jgi:hypothetical protein
MQQVYLNPPKAPKELIPCPIIVDKTAMNINREFTMSFHGENTCGS